MVVNFFGQPIAAGLYTFCNAKTGDYLSCTKNQIILSGSPKIWRLSTTGEGGFYVYANGTDLLLDIDNAYIASGTVIKLWSMNGYDVQRWEITQNKNGTYSFISSVSHEYCLGFNSRGCVLQIRDEHNSMQEWRAVRITDESQMEYRSFFSKGNIVEVQLPLDISRVISDARLQKWANDLETAYGSFYELTGFLPYNSIVVEAYKPSRYAGCAGYVFDGANVIHIDLGFIYGELEKMAHRNNDWNFCTLHEMGHMFDSHRAWNFETELMTDLKLVYVLERNKAYATPSEFDINHNFSGREIINAYRALGADFSKTYNIFAVAQRLLTVKNSIGWAPFRQTFHQLQYEYSRYASASRQVKFELFINLLSYNSGKDIKRYFSASEWNTIINHLNSLK